MHFRDVTLGTSQRRNGARPARICVPLGSRHAAPPHINGPTTASSVPSPRRSRVGVATRVPRPVRRRRPCGTPRSPRTCTRNCGTQPVQPERRSNVRSRLSGRDSARQSTHCRSSRIRFAPRPRLVAAHSFSRDSMSHARMAPSRKAMASGSESFSTQSMVTSSGPANRSGVPPMSAWTMSSSRAPRRMEMPAGIVDPGCSPGVITMTSSTKSATHGWPQARAAAGPDSTAVGRARSSASARTRAVTSSPGGTYMPWRTRRHVRSAPGPCATTISARARNRG